MLHQNAFNFPFLLTYVYKIPDPLSDLVRSTGFPYAPLVSRGNLFGLSDWVRKWIGAFKCRAASTTSDLAAKRPTRSIISSSYGRGTLTGCLECWAAQTTLEANWRGPQIAAAEITGRLSSPGRHSGSVRLN